MLKHKKLTGVENGGGMILRERPRVNKIEQQNGNVS